MSKTQRSNGVSRRDFLRLGLGGATATLFLPTVGCSGGDSPPDDRVPILWIETGVCTGCACALLGSPAPTAEDLLPGLRLAFQETLMEAAGASAMDALLRTAGSEDLRYVLVVDGAIPVGPSAGMTMLGADGASAEHSAASLVGGLASRASCVVAVGTCACFGGIPASGVGVAHHASLAEVIGKAPLRIPGCPPNPAWLTGTLQSLLRGEKVEQDALGRPTLFFGNTVHASCPRLERFEARDFATAPGDPTRCLLQVGCKGPWARGDCPKRLWQGRSYCIKANHPCIGCTAPGFLDARPVVDGVDVDGEGQATSPFYAQGEGLP